MQSSPATRVLNVSVGGGHELRGEHARAAYPWPEALTCAGIHDGVAFRRVFPALRYVPITPGQPLPFRDAEFDLIYSNAVIEHVGGPAQQRRFLEELLRV